MPSPPRNSAAHARAPFLVVNSSPAPSFLNIEPRVLLAAMPATSNLAKNLWPSFSRPKSTPPTPLTSDMPPTPSLPRSVSPSPPTSPPSDQPLAPLSLTAALPHTSETQVHSHCAQEQDTSKVEKYNTAPTKKPPQARRHFDSDDDPGNKTSATTTAHTTESATPSMAT